MKSAFKLNWLYYRESLTCGTHWSVDPTGQRDQNRAGGATLRTRPELADDELAGGNIFTV